MEKNNRKSAKVDQDAAVSPHVIHITINGDVYTTSGASYADSLMQAVDEHIEKDLEFTEFITISAPGHGSDEVYAPAVLCTFGYLGKGELADFLLRNVIEEVSDAEQDFE